MIVTLFLSFVKTFLPCAYCRYFNDQTTVLKIVSKKRHSEAALDAPCFKTTASQLQCTKQTIIEQSPTWIKTYLSKNQSQRGADADCCSKRISHTAPWSTEPKRRGKVRTNPLPLCFKTLVARFAAKARHCEHFAWDCFDTHCEDLRAKPCHVPRGWSPPPWEAHVTCLRCGGGG